MLTYIHLFILHTECYTYIEVHTFKHAYTPICIYAVYANESKERLRSLAYIHPSIHLYSGEKRSRTYCTYHMEMRPAATNHMTASFNSLHDEPAARTATESSRIQPRQRIFPAAVRPPTFRRKLDTGHPPRVRWSATLQ